MTNGTDRRNSVRSPILSDLGPAFFASGALPRCGPSHSPPLSVWRCYRCHPSDQLDPGSAPCQDDGKTGLLVNFSGAPLRRRQRRIGDARGGVGDARGGSPGPERVGVSSARLSSARLGAGLLADRSADVGSPRVRRAGAFTQCR